MRGAAALAPVLALAAAFAAPPLVPGAVPPLHERPSQGEAVSGRPLDVSRADTLRVCVIRAQFLEDFTTSTSGDGRFDLGADPHHDRLYFEDLSDGLSSYYSDVSGDRLVIVPAVFPAGLNDAYTLDHQMAYYGADADWVRGSCELLRDAVWAADPDVDFSEYDAVLVFHAGAGQEADIYGNSPDDLGSVFLTLIDMIYYMPGAGFEYQGIPTDDGVTVREGSILPEQESQDGFGLGVLGTVCHEFGHQLGLPDLYDTMTGGVGIGGWGLMGYGQWMMSGFWPTGLSAWSRIYLGWAVTREVSEGDWTSTPGDTILKVPLNGSEYLLIENRMRDPDGDGLCGIHERDFALAGSGVLIWHIDETRLGGWIDQNRVNVDPAHKGVDLEEADGIQDFDYSLPDIYGYEGSEYDPWYRGGYAWLFGPETEPSSDASWGGATFVTVDVLDAPSDAMALTVTRTAGIDGWPVQAGPLRWEPMIWEDPDGQGDLLVAVTTTGFARGWRSDGEGPLPMGNAVTAPPAVGRPGPGAPLLLVCEDDGEVHLRGADWSEPDGWPLRLAQRAAGIHCLVSSRLEAVAVADDQEKVHLFAADGVEISGWPVSAGAPVVALAVFPDEASPGIVAATSDGRIHLWDMSGRPFDGWPVSPGSERTGIPLSADINRDGSAEVVAVNGGSVYAYALDGSMLPGFPADLPGEPLGSPCLSDLDGDGRLETIVPFTGGAAAIGSSGATLEDWPVIVEQDSLTASWRNLARGIGGRGFTLIPFPDGRVCMLGPSGSPLGMFPISAGDYPIGRALLWDPEGDGTFRVTAADSSGSVFCWSGAPTPDGWFTGLDMSGENCWWPDDLPPIGAAGGSLAEGSFYVYPNPVRSGEGAIRFLPGLDCGWEVRVFNMAGELVTFEAGTAPGGAAWEVPWDTSDLAPGVYLVCLRLTDGSGTADALVHAAVVN
jgi:M6 family metalloprotease-like protein